MSTIECVLCLMCIVGVPLSGYYTIRAAAEFLIQIESYLKGE